MTPPSSLRAPTSTSSEVSSEISEEIISTSNVSSKRQKAGSSKNRRAAVDKRTPGFLGMVKEKWINKLEGKLWWERSDVLGPGSGYHWKHLYARDKFLCAYCGADLRGDIATLAGGTRDHLVPRYLEEIDAIKRPSIPPSIEDVVSSDGPPATTGMCQNVPRKRVHHLHRPSNLVCCCGTCNSLKGDWTPELADKAWKSRQAYIAAARSFIEQQAMSLEKYMDCVKASGEDVERMLVSMPKTERERVESNRNDLSGRYALVRIRRTNNPFGNT